MSDLKARRPEWVFDDSEIEDTFGYGERAVDFLKRLKHPASESGNFDLPRFWERITRRIYGPCHENGRRKVKTVFIMLPRGARKTTWGAGLALLHTVGWERVKGGQAMVAASAEEDATLAYNEAISIIDETEWLQGAMKPTESLFILEHKKSKAKFRALASGGRGKLGKTPRFVLADELVAWEGENSRKLWAALRTGLNKVPGTLLVIITQAGRGQQNLAYDLLTYARRVQSGEIEDEGFLPVLFETLPDADFYDERLWYYVNPGLADGYPDIDGIRQLAREAKNRPSELANLKQFHLNCWEDSSIAPFVPMPVYDEGAKPAINADTLADLEANRTPVYIGVDLSTNIDLTAIVMAWGNQSDGFSVYPHFFCPQSNLDERIRRDQVPYDRWRDEKLITATKGDVIDFRAVEDHLKELCARFNVAEIAFDPKFGAVMIANLIEAGLPAIEFSQQTTTMSPAVKELERAIIGRKFHHGGNPILRWHFDCIAIGKDRNDNVFFHKGKSRDRIDGAVATAMAVSRCAAGNSNRSSYDDAPDDFESWAFA